MRPTSWSSAAGRRGPRRRTGSPRPGHRVLVVEKKRFPREKTCGDGLTPRAVRQLEDMGLGERLAAGHLRYDGLRSIAHGVTLELEWPEHSALPVLRLRRPAPRPRRDGRRTGGEGRRDALAGGRGGRSRSSEGGLVTRRDRCRARRMASRGRCGPGTWWSPTARTPASGGRSVPPATGRTRWAWRCAATSRSPRHDDPWIESHLDIRDKARQHLPGYGWIFPVGDGTINVGVGLLSTFSGWKDVNTSHLMDAFCATAPDVLGDLAGHGVRRARPAASCRPGSR